MIMAYEKQDSSLELLPPWGQHSGQGCCTLQFFQLWYLPDVERQNGLLLLFVGEPSSLLNMPHHCSVIRPEVLTGAKQMPTPCF